MTCGRHPAPCEVFLYDLCHPVDGSSLLVDGLADAAFKPFLGLRVLLHLVPKPKLDQPIRPEHHVSCCRKVITAAPA